MAPVAEGSAWGRLFGGRKAQAGSQRAGEKEGQAASQGKEEHEQRWREAGQKEDGMGWIGGPPVLNNLSEAS